MHVDRPTDRSIDGSSAAPAPVQPSNGPGALNLLYTVAPTEWVLWNSWDSDAGGPAGARMGRAIVSRGAAALALALAIASSKFSSVVAFSRCLTRVR